ncbi:MAG TPA: class I SAM-dependent methyltransferase [Methylovirgula sp.]
MTGVAAASFFETWRTYQKVVAANYMYHTEISADIARLFEKELGARPFSLLDLGCGDAATLAPLLRKMAISHYKGVDLSAEALDLAAENLKALPCPIEFVHRDILSALAAEAGRCDVIYSSFAIHHLTQKEKAKAFRLIAERLNENGFLIMTDVVREDDETLPVYLDHYMGWIRDDWHGLRADEFAAIRDHIENNDLPETATDLSALTKAAGLDKETLVAKYRWHRVLQFRRAA